MAWKCVEAEYPRAFGFPFAFGAVLDLTNFAALHLGSQAVTFGYVSLGGSFWSGGACVLPHSATKPTISKQVLASWPILCFPEDVLNLPFGCKGTCGASGRTLPPSFNRTVRNAWQHKESDVALKRKLKGWMTFKLCASLVAEIGAMRERRAAHTHSLTSMPAAQFRWIGRIAKCCPHDRLSRHPEHKTYCASKGTLPGKWMNEKIITSTAQTCICVATHECQNSPLHRGPCL